jgi:mannose-6-phosphate isomerase-like protein (cupin superfamily)
MSAFTKLNLRGDVEDQAPKFGLAPELEARFAHDRLESEVTGLSYQRLAPGMRVPFGHTHASQEEIYVVLSGTGRAKLGDEIVSLSALDALRVAPQTMRALEAGPEGLEVVVFGAPRGERNDAEMAAGWWAD